jgi:hypothetical protein
MDPYEGLFNEETENYPWWLDFGLSPLSFMVAFGGAGLAYSATTGKKALSKLYRGSRGLAGLELMGSGVDPRRVATVFSNPATERARMLRRGKIPYAGPIDPGAARAWQQFENLHTDLRKVSRGTRGKNRIGGLWANARSQRMSYTRMASRYNPGVAAKIAIGGILGDVMTFVGITGTAYLGATMLGGVAESIANWQPTQSTNPQLEFGTGNIVQPRAAMTQRQRALMAIHNSQLATRSALGNEAAHIHS